MKQINWMEPWEPVADETAFKEELIKEISKKHILYKKEVKTIGKRIDCDDVLFELEDGALAVVHLTWIGKKDQDPQFPWTVMYTSIDDFVNNAMIPDANEYK